jgi:pilus assembly protein CpaB
MKSKTVILMIVAIVCGLAASYMTSRVIADRKDTEEEKVTVLVAKQNLAMGTMITEPEKFFEEKQYTKGEEPKKAIRDFAQIKEHRLNKPLGAEQFVSPDDLTDRGQDSLSGLMRKGMRAVGLKVNVDDIAGGFVLPQTRVDVVSVIRKGDQQHSKIILQNVLVLAVDTLSQRPDDRQAIVSNTVTVEVTPAEAEKLALATEMGRFRLILRPWGDEEKVTTKGASLQNLEQNSNTKRDEILAMNDGEGNAKPPWFSKIPDLLKTPAKEDPKTAAAPKPQSPPPPPPKPVNVHTLTIYNGESVTRATYSEEDKNGESKVEVKKSQGENSSTRSPKRP